ERHHQLDRIERIGAEIVDERSAVGHFLFLDAALFDHDLLDAFFDAAHGVLLLLRETSRSGDGRCVVYGNSRPASADAVPSGFTNSSRPVPVLATGRHAADQGMYMPPLTCRVSPVM